MASMGLFCMLLFLSSVISSTLFVGIEAQGKLDVNAISAALSSKGYTAMSMVLEESLTTLLPSESVDTAFTIFCPTDNAVLSSTSKYPQPPFTLLQYHIVPTSLDRDDLESSSLLRYESKIDTLLPGHPLVVTTLSKTQSVSINGIEIKQWDLYNDGHVIIHGIQDFFDPDFQILEYPWYDNNGGGAPPAAAATNNQNSSTSTTADSLAPTTRDSESVAAAKFKKLEIILVVVVAVVLVVLAYAVIYLCYYTAGRQRLQEYLNLVKKVESGSV